MPNTFDWVVIGGGVHGTMVAHFLLEKGCTTVDRLRIIDPHDSPMALWDSYTRKVGMEFLRSPGVHHLDLSPFSIQAFAKRQHWARSTAFYGPYHCPSLELFMSHCSQLIHQNQLQQCWHQGRVIQLQKSESSWIIETENDYMSSKHVIVATGFTEQLAIPSWAEGMKKAEHIFAQGKQESPASSNLPLVVIGGGISAVQTALKHAKTQKVILLCRHPLKIHDFDSDPGWLGPKYMRDFTKEPSFEKRRAMIVGARHRGSIPRYLYKKLVQAIRKGLVDLMIDEVIDARETSSSVNLKLESNLELQASRVLLATGFISQLDHIGFIRHLKEQYQLPCAPCGYPIVNSVLEWTNGLYVMGALAELEIGPTARNISGARKAAERIVKAAEKILQVKS